MSRYTGPKARVNRRLGMLVFESAGAAKAFDRRSSAPGMAPPVRKLSKYGESMREKQKIKYYYGLGERQLRKLFDRARRQTGNTGTNLLLLCERRFDNVVRLSGLTKTRPQARQGIGHGHFTLNGIATDVPSVTLRMGDVIAVKRRENLIGLYHPNATVGESFVPDWITLDASTLQATVQRLPSIEDVTLPVDIAMVVELLSR
jgi:small subunit ribosomal protein S4